MDNLNNEDINLIEEVRSDFAKVAMNNFLHGNNKIGLKPGKVNDYLASKELASKNELKKVISSGLKNDHREAGL